MWKDFKEFLFKQNALALAIGVVLGVALNAVVQSIVDGFIMPIVAAVMPGGSWRTSTLDVGPIHFGVGPFLSALLNFIIIGFVVWRISKAFIRPAPDAAPMTKPCPFCRMDIDPKASRCPHCTSQLGAVAA